MISGTSLTSTAIAVGDKTFATQPNLAFAAGQNVCVVSAIKATGGASVPWMAGTVKSYNATTGDLVVTVTSLNAAGITTVLAAWVITVYEANDIDLTTIQNAIAYLPEMMTAPPTLIQRLITSSSSFIQTHLDRIFTIKTCSEARNGNGHSVMPFYDYPVVAMRSLVIDGKTISPYVQGSGTIGYLFDIKTLYLKNGHFPKGLQNIQFSYDAGYQNIPSEIEQVTIDLISLKYKQRERIGLLSVHMGTETTSYVKSDLTDDTKRLLQQYQRVAPI